LVRPAAEERCSCGVVLETRLGYAYNEEAFRHFLNLERERTERSKRSLILVLLTLRNEQGLTTTIDAATAALVFAALLRSLRETDLVGWFREGKAIGVAAIAPEVPAADTLTLVMGKLRHALREATGPGTAARLRLRAREFPSRFGARY
jgi:hypothetical protein